MKKIGKLKVLKSSEVENSFVSIGFECLDRDLFNPEKCYDLLGNSGIKYARCQTGWAKTEKEKGVYDFAWLDSIVDNLLKRGVKPWFNVGFGNPLYMEDVPNPTAVGCVPLLYGEEVYDAWKRFIKALASHYKRRVEHFEIWNEPDISHFWHPNKPDGTQLSRLVKDTGSIIKSIIPNAKIGTCVSAMQSHYFGYVSDLFGNLSANDIDFFCYHIYTKIPEYKTYKLVSHIRKLLHENGLENVDIWQGEGGYPSWAYKGHWLVKEGCDDERSQAVYQLRRYFIDLYCDAKMSSFFQMADMWEKPYEKATEVLAKPAAHGILNGITYTPKKSYETISYLAAVLNGDVKRSDFYANADCRFCSVDELINIQVMTYEKDGSLMCAYYMPSDLSKELKKEYSVQLEMCGKIHDPVLVDMYNGDVYEIEDICPNRLMTVFTDLPMKDYPLVIISKSVIEVE